MTKTYQTRSGTLVAMDAGGGPDRGLRVYYDHAPADAQELPITFAQLDQWVSGGDLIQRVFPDLTPDQREFLITGLTSDQWTALFGDGDD